MGELRVMGREGDVRTTWDRNNPDEVATARATFDEMTGKGHWAYAVRRDGSKGEMIRKFDPNMEKIILAPRMQGG